MKGKHVLIHPYVVTYSVGVTINTGNYESQRIMMGLSVPIYEAKKVKPTLRKIQEIVDKELKRRVEEVRKTVKFSEPKDVEEIVEEVLEEDLE